MEIEVKIYGDLRRFAPGDKSGFTLRMAPGATVGDAVVMMGIPPDVQRVTLVGGRRAPDEMPLEPGATMVLFSPVAGG
jgi:molybdopterin converting factor small subunit